jgi:UDP-N-acetylglucosamine--N-acetylmuramyl-(pentapeptide) pyrophosphoryl-undecaprenol N-acetylglucosamine transferase
MFVGTGGYLSLPAGIAAFILGIKVVIQEQNSSPGMESRILGRFAERIFLGFNGCVKYFQKEKCMVYGNPVRVSLNKYTSKAAARLHFFPNLMKKRDGEAQVWIAFVIKVKSNWCWYLDGLMV